MQTPRGQFPCCSPASHSPSAHHGFRWRTGAHPKQFNLILLNTLVFACRNDNTGRTKGRPISILDSCRSSNSPESQSTERSASPKRNFPSELYYRAFPNTPSVCPYQGPGHRRVRHSTRTTYWPNNSHGNASSWPALLSLHFGPALIPDRDFTIEPPNSWSERVQFPGGKLGNKQHHRREQKSLQMPTWKLNVRTGCPFLHSIL